MKSEKLLKYLTDKRLILCNYDFGSFGAGEMYHLHEDAVEYFDLYYGNLKVSTQQQLYAWSCKLLWLNSWLEEGEFVQIVTDVSHAEMGLCVRSFSEHTANVVANRVYYLKYQNKLYLNIKGTRKLIFNPALPIPKEEKSKIIAELFGFKKIASSERITATIEMLYENKIPITNKSIADSVGVTEHTVSRNMDGETRDLIKQYNKTMKDEELLNKAMEILGHMDKVSVRELQEILNTRNVPVLKQAIELSLANGVQTRKKGQAR